MSGNDSQSPPKKQLPGQPQPGREGGFSIDNERSIQLEIPSVTRLLNRRKLEIEAPPAEAPKSPVQASVPSKPQIRGVQRAERRSGARLQVLPEGGVAPAGTPESAEALALSLRQATGAQWVLILDSQADSRDFQARAILGGDRTLWNLLTGFHWGASASPASYQELAAKRFLELTALSSQADARALRAALAMEQTLGLWLFADRLPPAAPSFVLMAALSDSSLVQSWLKKTADLFQNRKI